MTSGGTPKADCTDSTLATTYEQLRASVLEGSSAGGHFGLVIVLREGLGAWMEHASASSVLSGAAPRGHRAMSTPMLSDESQADMVALLANMTLATTQNVPEQVYA